MFILPKFFVRYFLKMSKKVKCCLLYLFLDDVLFRVALLNPLQNVL